MMATTFSERPAAVPSPLTSGAIVANWKPIALVTFAVWVFFVGAGHEPWFDEAQAWLLARDNDLVPLLWEKVRYEGTPGLWHAVLWFAIHAGLPYSHLYVLPACFAIAGAGVVLWRAPFPPPLRMLLLASYFFGYQFSIVARSYCIDLLLVPLAASFFASRVDRPLRYALVVGLIANANAHGFLAAAVLGVEFAWRLWQGGKLREAKGVGGLMLCAGLGLVAMAIAKQPADNAFLHPEWRGHPVLVFMFYMGNAFIDRITVWSSDQVGAINMIAGFGISMVLLRPIISLVAKGQNRLLMIGLFGLSIGFSIFIYSSPWHAGLLFLFWVFLLWTHWDVPVSQKLKRDVTIAMTIICLAQASEAVVAGVWDNSHPYSAGEPVASAIESYRETHGDTRVVALGYKAFDIQPWLPANAFANYHDGAAKPSYILWDRKELWNARVNERAWRVAVASRPDLVVASPLDPRKGTIDPTPWACRSGYGLVKKYRGTMTWRGAGYENENLLLFERGATGGCVR